MHYGARNLFTITLLPTLFLLRPNYDDQVNLHLLFVNEGLWKSKVSFWHLYITVWFILLTLNYFSTEEKLNLITKSYFFFSNGSSWSAHDVLMLFI